MNMIFSDMSMMINPQKVLIVEPNDSLREGLNFFVQSSSDVEWVGEAFDLADTLHNCQLLEPDIIIMSINAVRNLQDIILVEMGYPDIKLILLTDDIPRVTSLNNIIAWIHKARPMTEILTELRELILNLAI